MTLQKAFSSFSPPKGRRRIKDRCFLWLLSFCTLLLLKNAPFAVACAKEGLTLCRESVIPSLLPFMVLSELFVSSGLNQALPKPITALLKKVLGMPSGACTALILGFLCGFPVGAGCAVHAYRNGELSKRECERLMLFCNLPSPAFLINVLGIGLWQSSGFGVFLYGTSILLALAVGVISKRGAPKQKSPPLYRKGELFEDQKKAGGVGLLVGAVEAASKSLLTVCAYVSFFSCLIGTLNVFLARIGASEKLQTAVFCLFELSGGVSRATALPDQRLGAALSAFAVGWSGLSVHFQIRGICADADLSFWKFHLSKLAQGVAAALLTALLFPILPFF